MPNCPQECYHQALTTLGQNTGDHSPPSRTFFFLPFYFHDLPSVEPTNESPVFKNHLISLVLVALCLDCFARAFSSCGGGVGWGGRRLCSVLGLLAAAAALVAGHGLHSCSMWALRAQASAAVGRELRFSEAHGVFLDQGLNPCLLHWQEDS